MTRATLVVLVLLALMLPVSARQEPDPPAAPTSPFDQLLDVNVRDGLVYYRALKADRRRLDAYVAGLDVPAATVAGWQRDRQVAFWLNAYNALVLRTVVDSYPIRGAAAGSPANSIRQIPGAFDRKTWRVAGKAMTLDQIELGPIAAFKDARLFFAMGRGALGSGRLRSEAFDGARLDAQLTDVIDDCVRRVVCARIDQAGKTLAVSPIFGWRESQIAAAAGAAAGARQAGRSPLERAVIALIEPHLYPSEREWLAGNAFAIRYEPFDWRLNDLTGGPPK